MKVDGALKSLLQGVSQQPLRDRLTGQCSLQENMRSDPIKGLSRRGATELIELLFTSSAHRGWHDFETKAGVPHLAMFHDTTVKVCDLNGVFKTVTVDADAQAYLTGSTPLKAHTTGNNTYVVNRERTVTMDNDSAPYYNQGTGVFTAGIVQVLGGMYARTYTIAIDGVTVSTYLTPDGSDPLHAPFVQTHNIAQALFTSLVEPPGFTSYLKDDLIFIQNDNDTPFNLTVKDNEGNTNIKALTNTVARVEDLPKYAPHLYTVRVAEKADPLLDTWFKFIITGTETSPVPSFTYFGNEGYWQECVAPNTKLTLTNSTMPHVLVHDPVTDTFRFRRETWAKRAAGTTTSNPDPSFVNNKINAVGEFQSRLLFLSGDKLVGSRIDKMTDFWFGSVTAQVDTDPIDIGSKSDASILMDMVQHNKDLAIFSDTAQFIVSGRSKLTPANAAMTLTTAFEADLTAVPVSNGKDICFATKFGRFVGIREFFALGSSDKNDSREITQHVQSYIPGTATRLTASANYGTLLVHTGESNVVSMYQYIWQGEDKIQSAWSKLIFNIPVVWSFFSGEVVYIIYRTGDTYYLARMSLDVQASIGIDYHVHTDMQFDVPNVNTQFILPYAFLANQDLILVQGAGCPNPGLVVPIESIVGNVVTMKYDMLGGDVIAGVRTKARFVPTNPMVKDQDGVKIGTGDLTINQWLITVQDTGFITGKALTKWGDGEPVDFNARIVGDIDNVVGEQPLIDYTWHMPFGYNADLAEIELSNDTHLPTNILDIEWEGQYNKRGKRIKSGE